MRWLNTNNEGYMGRLITLGGWFNLHGLNKLIPLYRCKHSFHPQMIKTNDIMYMDNNKAQYNGLINSRVINNNDILYIGASQSDATK
jgi:hypothetical protein